MTTPTARAYTATPCPTCPPVELRRPELAEVGLGGVVARGIRECA